MMNLTSLQAVTLMIMKNKEELGESERIDILKGIKRTLKSAKYRHNKNKFYITFLENKKVIVKTVECSQLSVFECFLNSLLKKELKNKIVVISDTTGIYSVGDYDNTKYRLLNQETLIQLLNDKLRYFILKDRLEKKFKRLKKRLDVLKNTDKKSVEEWKKDSNLDKILKTMKQYNCESCFKFWKKDTEEYFPIFYSNWNTTGEYVDSQKFQASLRYLK